MFGRNESSKVERDARERERERERDFSGRDGQKERLALFQQERSKSRQSDSLLFVQFARARSLVSRQSVSSSLGSILYREIPEFGSSPIQDASPARRTESVLVGACGVVLGRGGVGRHADQGRQSLERPCGHVSDLERSERRRSFSPTTERERFRPLRRVAAGLPGSLRVVSLITLALHSTLEASFERGRQLTRELLQDAGID